LIEKTELQPLFIQINNFLLQAKMPRKYVRKTNRGTTPHAIMERAMYQVVNERRSLRSVASDFDINHMTLSRFIKKAIEVGVSNTSIGYIGNRKVFNDLQEATLERYLLNASFIYFGLTPKDVRRLAFECAERFGITMPQSWTQNGCAGVDWFELFMRRHPNLSIRTPEATSLSRATSFNRTNVGLFFSKLGEVMDRCKFDPNDIWNVDETGITTVQKPSKTVGAKGVKQVGGITSAERGTLVTVCAAVSAIGNSMPPMMIFPRKKFKDHFIRDGPQGVFGGAHPSGWMTADNFLVFLTHFVKHAKPTPERQALLLLDNHHSHLAVQTLAFAKLNGIVMLSFPPHCSHKLQPLDRTVFGPLKRHATTAQDCWLRNNPGKPMTIYDIPGILRDSWPNALTHRNIVSGFRVSGIHPMNSDIFGDSDFSPAYVTDRPMQTNPENQEQRETTGSEASQNDSTNQNETEPMNEEHPTGQQQQTESDQQEQHTDRPEQQKDQEHFQNNQSHNENQYQEQKNDNCNNESTPLLDTYLKERKRVIVNVRGDGHCILYAFKLCMRSEFDEDISIDQMSHDLKEEAISNQMFYNEFTSNNRDLVNDIISYVTERNYMSESADLILALLCNIYRVQITVVKMQHNNKIVELIQSPSRSNMQARGNIYLVLNGTGLAAHYNATVKDGYFDTPRRMSASFDPEEVRPFPKAPPRKTTTKASSRKRKSAILTDTPEKRALEEEFQRRSKTKSKPVKRKLPLKKQNASKKQKPKQNVSINSSDEEEWFCLVCLEPYSNSRPSECWVQCTSCKK